jgi:hypothetical protein
MKRNKNRTDRSCVWEGLPNFLASASVNTQNRSNQAPVGRIERPTRAIALEKRKKLQADEYDNKKLGSMRGFSSRGNAIWNLDTQTCERSLYRWPNINEGLERCR